MTRAAVKVKSARPVCFRSAAAVHARSLAMFSSRHLFHDVPCPLRGSCNHPFCLFSHSPTAVFNLTQVDAVTTVSTTTTVPAKRHAQADVQVDPQQVPSSSRPSQSSSAERHTKLQRTGSASRPVAVPTASSSPVSSIGPVLHQSPGLFNLLTS